MGFCCRQHLCRGWVWYRCDHYSVFNTDAACIPLSAGTAEVLRSVWISDDNNVYAAGDKGTIILCSVGSDSCKPLSSNISPLYQINRIWGSDSNNIYAISSGGTIARCAVGSTTCTALNSGTAAPLNSVWGADDMNVYAVGNNGTVVRCSAGSTTCSVLTSGTNRDSVPRVGTRAPQHVHRGRRRHNPPLGFVTLLGSRTLILTVHAMGQIAR